MSRFMSNPLVLATLVVLTLCLFVPASHAGNVNVQVGKSSCSGPHVQVGVGAPATTVVTPPQTTTKVYQTPPTVVQGPPKVVMTPTVVPGETYVQPGKQVAVTETTPGSVCTTASCHTNQTLITEQSHKRVKITKPRLKPIATFLANRKIRVEERQSARVAVTETPCSTCVEGPCATAGPCDSGLSE